MIEYEGEVVGRPDQEYFKMKQLVKRLQTENADLKQKVEEGKKHMAALEKALADKEHEVKVLKLAQPSKNKASAVVAEKVETSPKQ